MSFKPITIKLDESKYGTGLVAWKKSYLFSSIDGDGNKTHIAAQNGDGKTLVAVTKEQHKAWKKNKFVSTLMPWSAVRLAICMAQASKIKDPIYTIHPREIRQAAEVFDKIINFIKNKLGK